MKTMVDVKPGEGRLVRMPNGVKLTEAGARVERTALIERWLANGDLVEVPLPTAAAGKTEAAGTAKTGDKA